MEYICGAYERLSEADNKTDESSSIQSQKIIIESFTKYNNLKIYKHYVDDGYSGGNFDRPAFKEMINDIESGKINCVVTKDLSRLGREMYKTGKYIEEYFLEKGIRYIAINDSYDSNIGDSMLGIRLSVNDLYLRDVSKKVKTALRAKQNRGDYIGSFPLYGYKKDPDDRHKLIVDEEVRHIIELIYDLALEGKSPNKIAEYLTLKKIPIPIVHKHEPRANNVSENDGFGIWKRQTVSGILTNQMYIGNMVQNTHNKISYNSKKLRKTSKDEIIIVEGTHEGIISKEAFNKVQKLLNDKSKIRVTDHQLDYLLGGLLYCHECGRNIRISEDILKSGVRHYTQCNLYTRKGKYGICSSHRINYDWLEEDILEYLQEVCEKFCKNYDFDELNDNSEIIVMKNLQDINQKIERLNNMLNSYKSTIDNLYIDKIKGLVDEEMYKRIYNKTKIEIEKINLELEDLNRKKQINEKQTSDSTSFNKCKRSVLNYMSLNNPTKEQITRLIDRIEIDKEKKVYVHLRFPELIE
jgi:DNA invertase Pin-like site-specific DNA recombinase